MGQKHTSAQFRPEFPGTQSVKSDANKGKQMNTKGSKNPDYVPDKGK
ncbi:acid-soluble spore protein N [Salipaludibacillus neizhouensis]|uniref:Acid-soluble spore protein N n=1 Tax=Salipaludibacillus neizhouensis TaxID=885475 RepID=A0A3A9KC08_9BACI|nr:small acid-soluble spore protein N [Salipaludibacillus neizhouensis]RKL69168.1 acid-soluble spore protein N [Salipaludibacillus neizhouensis]